MIRTVLCIIVVLSLTGCGSNTQEKCTEADKKAIGEGKHDNLSGGCRKCMLSAVEGIKDKCASVCKSSTEECAKCVKDSVDPALQCM